MEQFRDSAGRDWPVDINISTVKRVRAALDVDLLDLADERLYQRLVDDPVFLVDLLYVIVQPEAERREVSDVQFGEALAGDAIDAASKALLDELVNFTPSRKRKLLARALEKLDHFQAKAIDEAIMKLESPETDRAIEAALAKIGAMSTDSPESSESIPEAGHSANSSTPPTDDSVMPGSTPQT